MVDNDIMLTTLDNPYNPFTQFDLWNNYDITNGYYTCAYLARVAKSSDELSENDQNSEIDRAIDEIISLNLTNNYIKVTPESFNSRIKSKK